MYWILVFTTKKDPQVENVQSVPLSKIKPLRFKEKKSHSELQSLPDTTGTQGTERPAVSTADHSTEWKKMVGPSARRSSVQAWESDTSLPPGLDPHISAKATRHVSHTLAFSSWSCCPEDSPSLCSGSQSRELLWLPTALTASKSNFLLFFNWFKWDLDFICAEKTKTK